MYAKTTQKTKKCLRCGCSHKVSTVINSGVIVKRMTEAVNMVKYKLKLDIFLQLKVMLLIP